MQSNYWLWHICPSLFLRSRSHPWWKFPYWNIWGQMSYTPWLWFSKSASPTTSVVSHTGWFEAPSPSLHWAPISRDIFNHEGSSGDSYHAMNASVEVHLKPLKRPMWELFLIWNNTIAFHNHGLTSNAEADGFGYCERTLKGWIRK